MLGGHELEDSVLVSNARSHREINPAGRAEPVQGTRGKLLPMTIGSRQPSAIHQPQSRRVAGISQPAVCGDKSQNAEGKPGVDPSVEDMPMQLATSTHEAGQDAFITLSLQPPRRHGLRKSTAISHRQLPSVNLHPPLIWHC